MKRYFLLLSVFLLSFSGCDLNDKNSDLILQALDEANHCQVDADCMVLAGLECPFGCYSLINKTVDANSLRQKMDAYRRSSGAQKCEYGCTESPSLDQIKCLKGKCIDIRKQ